MNHFHYASKCHSLIFIKSDRETNEWETLPNLPTGRYSGGCGVVRNGTGTYVVVVGGYYSDYSDVVEIYSIEEGTWKSGKGCFCRLHLEQLKHVGVEKVAGFCIQSFSKRRVHF